MGLKRAFRHAVSKEEFFPGALSFLTSPYFIARSSLLSAIRPFCPGFKGEILDFGCGSKPYEELFVNSSSYVGVDVQVSGHDHSTSKVDYFYENARLPFDNDKFDGAVSFEVFEHVENLPCMVREIFRVLKPGAQLLVTTPFIFPEHEVPYDFRRHTRYGLQSLLEAAGFEIAKTETFPGSVLSITQCVNDYLFRSLSPNSTAAKAAIHLLITLPNTIMAYLMSLILPKGQNIYLGLVVLARKPHAA